MRHRLTRSQRRRRRGARRRRWLRVKRCLWGNLLSRPLIPVAGRQRVLPPGNKPRGSGDPGGQHLRPKRWRRKGLQLYRPREPRLGVRFASQSVTLASSPRSPHRLEACATTTFSLFKSVHPNENHHAVQLPFRPWSEATLDAAAHSRRRLVHSGGRHCRDRRRLCGLPSGSMGGVAGIDCPQRGVGHGKRARQVQLPRGDEDRPGDDPRGRAEPERAGGGPPRGRPGRRPADSRAQFDQGRAGMPVLVPHGARRGRASQERQACPAQRGRVRQDRGLLS